MSSAAGHQHHKRQKGTRTRPRSERVCCQGHPPHGKSPPESVSARHVSARTRLQTTPDPAVTTKRQLSRWRAGPLLLRHEGQEHGRKVLTVPSPGAQIAAQTCCSPAGRREPRSQKRVPRPPPPLHPGRSRCRPRGKAQPLRALGTWSRYFHPKDREPVRTAEVEPHRSPPTGERIASCSVHTQVIHAATRANPTCSAREAGLKTHPRGWVPWEWRPAQRSPSLAPGAPAEGACLSCQGNPTPTPHHLCACGLLGARRATWSSSLMSFKATQSHSLAGRTFPQRRPPPCRKGRLTAAHRVEGLSACSHPRGVSVPASAVTSEARGRAL